MTVPPGPACDTLYGLIRLAGLCIAVPVTAIREVVPCPAQLDRFPASRPDIVGALELRGEVIPVIDLACALCCASEAREETSGARSIVVILCHETCVFGVLADGIVGVMPLTSREINPLDHTGPRDGQNLFANTFRVDQHTGVVLDPGAVLALPGMIAASDRSNRGDIAHRIDDPILIFTVAGLRLALLATCVDASLPRAKAAAAPVETDLWIGLREYKGMEIPVVDTLRLLGHGALPENDRSGATIVIRTALPDPPPPGCDKPFGLIALLIDTVDDIGRFAAHCFAPLMQDNVYGAHLSGGLLVTAQGTALLIDPAKLAAIEELRTLGALTHHDGRASAAQIEAKAEAAVSAPAKQPFLVFSVAGTRLSTPLETVEEILFAETAMLPMPSGESGTIGLFASRGHCVPVLDLSFALGNAATRNGRYIIVTRSDTPQGVRRAGFRVDELHSVDRKMVQVTMKHQGGSPPSDDRLRGLGPTIRLDNGRACTVLDLAGEAERLLNGESLQVA